MKTLALWIWIISPLLAVLIGTAIVALFVFADWLSKKFWKDK